MHINTCVTTNAYQHTCVLLMHMHWVGPYTLGWPELCVHTSTLYLRCCWQQSLVFYTVVQGVPRALYGQRAFVGFRPSLHYTMRTSFAVHTLYIVCKSNRIMELKNMETSALLVNNKCVGSMYQGATLCTNVSVQISVQKT
jgi:hypothetical protein